METGTAHRGNNEAQDAFTREHWNGRINIVVYPAPSPAEADVEERSRALFGHTVASAAWGWLVGAPDGATVHVLPSPARDYEHGVQIRVEHPWFDGAAIRYVIEDPDGDLAMINESLRVRDGAPAGIGTRLLAQQAVAAQSLGVLYIAAEAVGSPGGTANGYYTWARLGFDGPIPAQARTRLPDEWRAAETVLDLIERSGGPQWWRAHGRSFAGIFDLRAGSRSWRTLQDYTTILRREASSYERRP